MLFDQRFEYPQKQRYYRIILAKDLFGDWIVTRIWGGIGKSTGRVTHLSCTSHEEAMQVIKRILKIRISRGYELRENS